MTEEQQTTIQQQNNENLGPDTGQEEEEEKDSLTQKVKEGTGMMDSSQNAEENRVQNPYLKSCLEDWDDLEKEYPQLEVIFFFFKANHSSNKVSCCYFFLSFLFLLRTFQDSSILTMIDHLCERNNTLVD